jgi:uncharacterized protein YpmB
MTEYKFTINKKDNKYVLCGENEHGKQLFVALSDDKDMLVNIGKSCIVQEFEKENK